MPKGMNHKKNKPLTVMGEATKVSRECRGNHGIPRRDGKYWSAQQ